MDIGLHVLVIEDDPGLRELLTVLLNLEDLVAKVEAVETAEGAIEACRFAVPDVVIADSALGPGDNVPPGQHLRQLFPALRIISFSGSEGERAWADLHITKAGKGLDEVVEAVREVARLAGAGRAR